ncbi:PglL family O-oligosaccharyltransferase [Rhodoferax mekongensis]|uniref:Wzy polymerase domain-containing protein n=1 Tax=Rhodoferax mekongensis TaxID=3068341 RepID=A0ABZ0B3C8_9BURK|nr:Wzy polymerase domain-containing protein [Rhodoferax sp. TBRC 17307]WNO05569.1 Wzy polymerase domain-containing protein [Rhodoferax sp. TBRC 17307]
MKIFLSKLSFWVLGLCWLIPDHFPPWTAYHTEFPAFAAVALIGIALVFRNAVDTTRGEACVFALIFIVTIVSQIFTKQYLGDVLVGIVYLGLVCISVKWHRLDAKNLTTLYHLQLLLVWVSIAVSFQVISQQLNITSEFGDLILEPLPNGRARANLGQSNQAATTLVLGVIAALGLQARGKICVATIIFIQAYFAIAIAATQSRTAILSEVLVVMYMIVFGFKQKKRFLNYVLPLLVPALLGIAYWLWMYFSGDFSGESQQVELRTAPGTRGLIWKQFAVAIFEKPILGWGWGQLAAAQQFGADIFPGIEQANYAHNILLDIFVTFGVPFAVVLLFLVSYWMIAKFTFIRKAEEVYWSMAMLIPLVIHSLLELPHAYSYFLAVAGVLCGVINSYGTRGTLISFGRGFVVLMYSSWLALVLLIAYEYKLVEEDFRVNRFENRRIGVTPAEYEIPNLNLLDQYQDLLDAMRMRATPGMADNDVLLLERVSERFGWAPLLFRSTLASALNGRENIAQTKMRTLCSLFSREVCEEAKQNIITLSEDRYPHLKNIDFDN